jgi:hypothetical protein
VLFSLLLPCALDLPVWASAAYLGFGPASRAPVMIGSFFSQELLSCCSFLFSFLAGPDPLQGELHGVKSPVVVGSKTTTNESSLLVQFAHVQLKHGGFLFALIPCC